jgi:hypothetical protein
MPRQELTGAGALLIALHPLLHLLARWLVERIDEQVSLRVQRELIVGVLRHHRPRLALRLAEAFQVHERLDDDEIALGRVGAVRKTPLALYVDGGGVVQVEAIQETGQPHNLVVDMADAIHFFGLDGSSPVPDAGTDARGDASGSSGKGGAGGAADAGGAGGTGRGGASGAGGVTAGTGGGGGGAAGGSSGRGGGGGGGITTGSGGTTGTAGQGGGSAGGCSCDVNGAAGDHASGWFMLALAFGWMARRRGRGRAP